MNHIVKISCLICLMGLLSCEDYLDKTIETDLQMEEVFKDFKNSQGFVEEMYAMIVDYGGAAHWQTFMANGEDAIGTDTWRWDYSVDAGDYWAWLNEKRNIYYGGDDTNAELAFDRHGIYRSSWAGIRKANIVIAYAESLMVDATPQEIDAIMGQAYFFRGFFHHEIMKFWGSIPYIDRPLQDDWKLDRPEKWEETALKIDKDFDKAIELLPVSWDDPSFAPGAKTRNQNLFRITKGAALALKGKNLLFAASPLMQKSESTYGYNKVLCALAAEAFAELLKIDRYQLVAWDDYSSVFYTLDQKYPNTTEYIFSQAGNNFYYQEFLSQNWQAAPWADQALTSYPTHNYIHNYFGMKDGLACNDSPLYDPNDPWSNRDPRFYKWVVIDGDQMIDDLGAATGNNEVHRYAEFFNGGEHRYPAREIGTRTGYLAKKWYPRSYNRFDGEMPSAFRVHVRLTDVYLMYAEAAVVAYGIEGKPSGFQLSALDAINALRERAVPDGSLNVQPQYLTSENVFMDEIRRERAVEMSWEGHRWMDIRRWKLGTDMKYREKTEITFDRSSSGKPINLVEKVLRTKVFEEKHYWLPFPKGDAELYVGFQQNPGW
ncbi:MAG: RagB/SusD family nutrient uptake outer membrane protein [Prolixibacteraceae bacterium]